MHSRIIAVAVWCSVGAAAVASGCSDGESTSGAGGNGGGGKTSSGTSGGSGDGGASDGGATTAAGGSGGAAGAGGGGGAEVVACHAPMAASGPMVIQGKSGMVLRGLHVTSTTGDCIRIEDSTMITIRESEIGPCAGNAVSIQGGSGVKIIDSYIHSETLSPGCCDNNDNVFASGTSDLEIRGNVLAYGESNIEVDGSDGVTVSGNFLLNPRGPFPRGQNFQSWDGSSNVVVENNYALSSQDTTKYLYAEDQEDSVNFGVTDGITARNNYITGGHSGSGCGLIADDEANGVAFTDNVLVDTGQCGIGIADGTGQTVQGNRVLNRTPVDGGGNTAIYVWKQYDGACGPVGLSGNVATEVHTDGTQSGYWNGGGCEPVTEASDVWDQDALDMLTPVDQKLPPPQIPPGPVNCVAVSPYTNW